MKLWPRFVLAGLLAGCKTTPDPVPLPLPPVERVAWEGRSPLRFLTDSSGSTRIHTLDFAGADTLRLRLTEFPSDVEAFRAFQVLATPEELRVGYFRDRNSQFFFHGPFLGELQLSGGGLLPASFLKERLAFRDETLFQKPKTFATFPLAGQIERSERILSPEFLGTGATDPLPAMAYECHADTALLFRGHPPFATDPMSWLPASFIASAHVDTLNWGREKRISGLLPEGKPLILWLFRGAVVGVWGCFDDVLALEYAEKLKKTAILWKNP